MRQAAAVGLAAVAMIGCAKTNPLWGRDFGGSSTSTTSGDTASTSSSGTSSSSEQTSTSTGPPSTGNPTANVPDVMAGTSTGDEPVTLGPFGPIEPVEGINADGFDDDDPTLTVDQLQIIFGSRRPGGAGGEDLYLAVRTTPNGPFDTPIAVAELNTPETETTPRLSADGSTLFFARGVPGQLDLFMATRPNPVVAFGTATPVAELNEDGDDAGLFMTPNGMTAFFCSNRTGSLGGTDLLRVSFDLASQQFGTPVFIDELSSFDRDCEPSLSPLGNLLVWSSNRNGTGDLFWAERFSNDTFGTVTELSELSTTGRQEDPWLAAGGSVIYFAQAQPDTTLDIVFARRR